MGKAAISGVFVINGHDYTHYVKQKTGLQWTRENTNDSDAGRDTDDEMHTNVTSHQRKLEVKLISVPFVIAQQLEQDLQGNDEGVLVTYPDIHDGLCTRLFYNTSVKAYLADFSDNGIIINDLSFSLISVKEAVIDE